MLHRKFLYRYLNNYKSVVTICSIINFVGHIQLGAAVATPNKIQIFILFEEVI